MNGFVPEMPRVAVLIPVFNDPLGLCTSLDSLLAAFRPPDLVTIVVDDGSVDPVRVAAHYETALGLVVLRFERNQGIERALNHGLGEAARLGATYLARLDAGDTIAVDRFQQQLAILESDQEVGLVGSSARFVDEDGRPLFVFSAPHTDGQIRRRMHLNSCILHPTAMFRMSVLERTGGYSTDYPAAEDYELFFRMLDYCRAACVPAALVTKELADGSISMRKRRVQLVSRLRIQYRHFDWRRIESYIGLAMTLVLMAIPNRMVLALKRRLGFSRY